MWVNAILTHRKIRDLGLDIKTQTESWREISISLSSSTLLHLLIIKCLADLLSNCLRRKNCVFTNWSTSKINSPSSPSLPISNYIKCFEQSVSYFTPYLSLVVTIILCHLSAIQSNDLFAVRRRHPRLVYYFQWWLSFLLFLVFYSVHRILITVCLYWFGSYAVFNTNASNALLFELAKNFAKYLSRTSNEMWRRAQTQ